MARCILHCVLLTLLLHMVEVKGVKIVMLQVFGKSHFMTTKIIGEELARRGHEVTQFVPVPKSEADHVVNTGEHSLKIVKFYQGFEQEELMAFFASLSSSGGIIGELKGYHASYKYFGRVCSSILEDDMVVKSIQNADLLFSEMQLLCGGIIAKKFNKKWVALAPSVEAEMLSLLARVYLNPSFFPSVFSGYTDEMSFSQRVWNLILHQTFIYLYSPVSQSGFGEFLKKHELSHFDIFEEMGTAEIYIGNCDFAFFAAYPMMPNNFCVGPFLAKPSKALPEDLETFMSSAKHGVVLVAFGTLHGRHTKEKVQAMAEAFGKLDQKVLWLLKESHGVVLPPNIRATDWLPQNDVLGHPNLKLFVSHVGQSSMLEAGYHGVPVLAVPFDGDQFSNADFVSKKLKMGNSIDFATTTTAGWFDNIQRILTNEMYRKNALKVSRRIRARRQTPIEYAGELVQYVIDNDCDVSHLKSNAQALPWHVVSLWDVYAFLFVVICLGLAIVFLVLKVVSRVLCPSKKKTRVMVARRHRRISDMLTSRFL